MSRAEERGYFEVERLMKAAGFQVVNVFGHDRCRVASEKHFTHPVTKAVITFEVDVYDVDEQFCVARMMNPDLPPPMKETEFVNAVDAFKALMASEFGCVTVGQILGVSAE